MAASPPTDEGARLHPRPLPVDHRACSSPRFPECQTLGIGKRPGCPPLDTHGGVKVEVEVFGRRAPDQLLAVFVDPMQGVLRGDPFHVLSEEWVDGRRSPV
jgi:hypothetical protein